MTAEAIFLPVSTLVIWTGAVLLMTGLRRVLAVRAGRVPSDAFRIGESAAVPPELLVGNRNFMNLLEMPVLFYVGCLAFYVTRRVDSTTLTLAWIYVGLRLLHSYVHLGSNRVTVRFLVFASSNVVLLAMWVRFVRTLL
jgi:hypothetical protein